MGTLTFIHLHENTLECKFVAFCYKKRVDVVANRQRTIDVKRDKMQSGRLKI